MIVTTAVPLTPSQWAEWRADPVAFEQAIRDGLDAGMRKVMDDYWEREQDRAINGDPTAKLTDLPGPGIINASRT